MGIRSLLSRTGIGYYLPVVLCLVVPLAAFCVLVPMAQRSEQAATTGTQPDTVLVGTYQAEYRQSASAEFKLAPSPTIDSNATGRITRLFAYPGESLQGRTPLFEVDGRGVFAMDQAFPLYRDLHRGSTGDDVRALQVFLEQAGKLTSTSRSHNGIFGPETAQAVCALYRTAHRPCTGDFLVESVVFIPPGVSTLGAWKKGVGGSVVRGEAVISGAPTPSGVVITPTAPRGDLGIYGGDEIVVSTQNGEEMTLPRVSHLDQAETERLYEFLGPSPRADSVGQGSSGPEGMEPSGVEGASIAGFTIRKAEPSTKSLVPGNSILVGPTGRSCVITVNDQGDHHVVVLDEAIPAVGVVGQVLTDESVQGLVIIRDPSLLVPSAEERCT